MQGRIVNTSSPSGVFGNAGQTNYGAAKAGIAAFTIICGLELGRYGVCANAIAPVARTRMTEDLMGGGAPRRRRAFDALDPANISPLVVWLGSNDNADVNGRVFLVDGDRVSVAEGWRRGPTATQRRDALGAVAAHEGRSRPRGARPSRTRPCCRDLTEERSNTMPMNLDSVGAVSQPGRTSWTSKDALLYALGVGAGQTDPTGFELEFTTENSHEHRAARAADDAGRASRWAAVRACRAGASSTSACCCTASRA